MRSEEEQRHIRQKRILRHGTQLTVLVSICAVLIILATLETLLLANPEGFRVWREINTEGTSAEYSALILTRYLLDIIIPAGLSIYTYLTIARMGTPKLYRLVWGAIVFLSALRKAFAWQTRSFFWYMSLLLWAALLLVVANIHRLEKEPPIF